MLQEALGAHAVLDRMGFETEDLYMGVQRQAQCRQPHLFVILRCQGQQFSYDVGHLPTEDVGVTQWEDKVRQAYDVWNQSPQYERDYVFRRSFARRNAAALIEAVMRKGITPPAGAR